MSAIESLPKCAHYAGVAGNGETIYLTCEYDDMIGSTLVVQIPGDGEILTICELEIYGGECMKIVCVECLHGILV